MTTSISATGQTAIGKQNAPIALEPQTKSNDGVRQSSAPQITGIVDFYTLVHPQPPSPEIDLADEVEVEVQLDTDQTIESNAAQLEIRDESPEQESINSVKIGSPPPDDGSKFDKRINPTVDLSGENSMVKRIGRPTEENIYALNSPQLTFAPSGQSPTPLREQPSAVSLSATLLRQGSTRALINSETSAIAHEVGKVGSQNVRMLTSDIPPQAAHSLTPTPTHRPSLIAGVSETPILSQTVAETAAAIALAENSTGTRMHSATVSEVKRVAENAPPAIIGSKLSSGSTHPIEQHHGFISRQTTAQENQNSQLMQTSPNQLEKTQVNVQNNAVAATVSPTEAARSQNAITPPFADTRSYPVNNANYDVPPSKGSPQPSTVLAGSNVMLQAHLTKSVTMPDTHAQIDQADSLLASSDIPEILSWDQMRSAPQPGFALPLKGDMAPHIARQMIEVMAHAAHRPVEIALSPQELGRVRISVKSEDGTITVSVMAERPETLDLMRRNIDQLGQTFRAMGYESISFAFEQGSGNGDMSSNNSDQGPDISVDQNDTTTGATPAIIQLDQTPTTGVDIRL